MLDVVVIMKGGNGSVEASASRRADDIEAGEFRALERDLTILLAEEDRFEFEPTGKPDLGVGGKAPGATASERDACY